MPKPSPRPIAAAAAALLLAVPPVLAADFEDGDYHAEVIIAWETAHLDVLIVPPAAAYAPWRLQALVDTTEDWAAAIADHGPSWLADGVELAVYAPGVHAAPPAGFEPHDPEIVILLSTEPGALGVAVYGDECDPFASSAPHQHPGSPWAVSLRVPCQDGPETLCFIVNTSWHTTQHGLYRLNAHEFGHCLGAGHVGDAGDFSTDAVPSEDVMSYTHDPSLPFCPSSLDLLAIQAAFADVLGGTSPPLDPPLPQTFGIGFVSQDPLDYEQYPCDGVTPVPAPLPDEDWFPL